VQLPIARGKLLTTGSSVTLVMRCSLCGKEHRYDKSPLPKPELEELRRAGFSEEWLPCQHDLPGNFARITFGPGPRRPPSHPRRDVA